MPTAIPRAPRRARGVPIPLLVLLLCGAALGALLVGAGTASAHAALRDTDPAEDAVLKTAPKRVTLTFTAGLGISDDSIRVLDPSGNRVDRGGPRHVGGEATARVALRGDLPQGTFTVAWRGVSADGHPVAGAFIFSIGKPSGTNVALPAASPGGGAAGILVGLGRYVAYGGFALLAGVTAFLLLCWPRGVRLRPVRRLLITGWSGLLLSTVALLVLRGPYETGKGLGAAFDASVLAHTLGTRQGVALAARLLLLLVGVCALPALRAAAFGRPAPVGSGGGRVRPLTIAAGALLATGLAGTWAAAEHASAGPQVPLAMAMDILHLLAMALWLGGLAALLATLYRAPAQEEIGAEAVGRFSRLAFSAVAVLAATGAYQSWRQVGSWDALVSTFYGKLLVAKLYAVLVMLTAAGYSRRWTARLRQAPRPAARPLREREPAVASRSHGGSGQGGAAVPPPAQPAPPAAADRQGSDADPQRRGLRRSVAIEAGVGVVVLVITAVLTGTQPGRAAAAAERSASAPRPGLVPVTVPFDTGAPGGTGKGKVEITLDPGRPGANQLQAVVIGPDGGIADIPELRVAFTLPRQDIGPLKASLRNVGGYWVSEDLRLPAPGDWEMAVTVRTSGIDQDTRTGKVRIG